MKTFAAVFLSSAMFGASMGVVYWFASHEYAGTFMLGFMAMALSFAAGYALVSERNAALGGDNAKLTHKEAAGQDLGIFTKQSAWPIVLAFSILWTLLGAVWSDFVLFTGIAAILLVLWRLGAESARISNIRIPNDKGTEDLT